MQAKNFTTCPHCEHHEIYKQWEVAKKDFYFSILWCKNCGFGWQHPYPRKDDLKVFYTKQNLYHEGIVDEHQGGFIERIQTINKLKPAKGSILDIGSGMGHFILQAKVAGWEVEGIEPRYSACSFCYKNFGIEVYNGHFQDWSSRKLYDVITLWDVVEHVPSPMQIFDRCTSLLAPDGLLIFSIPNASGIPARLLKGKWRYAMRPHINYFTMPFITTVIRNNGLQIHTMQHSIKLQSIFEGFVSYFMNKFDPENIYRKISSTPNCHNIREQINSRSFLKAVLRKFVFKFNKLSYSVPIGDLVDIYCSEIDGSYQRTNK